MIGEVLKKGSLLIPGKAKVHPETRRQWYLLGAMELGRDDLRVVRCRWRSVREDYQLLEHSGWSYHFQTAAVDAEVDPPQYNSRVNNKVLKKAYCFN